MQVRNRGTVAGSVAHADPAGDWPAAPWRSTLSQDHRPEWWTSMLLDAFILDAHYIARRCRNRKRAFPSACHPQLFAGEAPSSSKSEQATLQWRASVFSWSSMVNAAERSRQPWCAGARPDSCPERPNSFSTETSRDRTCSARSGSFVRRRSCSRTHCGSDRVA